MTSRRICARGWSDRDSSPASAKLSSCVTRRRSATRRQRPAVESYRFDDPEGIVQYRRVAEAVLRKNYDSTIRELGEAVAAGSKGHRGYIAYLGSEPVAVGRLYTDADSVFGGLYGGSTREEFRGRGCYRALVAARARDARAFGARYLIVDALPTSRPILERLGFQWLTDTWPCEWRPVPGGAGAASG